MPDALTPIYPDIESAKLLPQAQPDKLTARQFEVITRVMKPNKVIARELGIQEITVKLHLFNATRQLNDMTRYEIMAALGAAFPEEYPTIILGGLEAHTEKMTDAMARFSETKQRVLPYSWLPDKNIVATTGVKGPTVKISLRDAGLKLGFSRNELIMALGAAGLLQPLPGTDSLPSFSPAVRDQIAELFAEKRSTKPNNSPQIAAK